MAGWSSNPADERLREHLANARRIAVVGLSDRAHRPSYGVAQYLQRQGYEIVPVNPRLAEWNGIPAVPSLRELPAPV
ncbi:MAG: CoA-binding protein, partial [Thermomicrobiales bacterium]|nr:CoA-binding protein [Thermomicrobiales bacterium]